jgi:uncharacterized protein (TIGR00369 family)
MGIDGDGGEHRDANRRDRSRQAGARRQHDGRVAWIPDLSRDDHPWGLATLADEALASVAFTAAEEGETTVTADLKVDFLRPAKPGRLLARATVRHRTRRLAFCEATVEQDGGPIVAEARAVIAYVKA